MRIRQPGCRECERLTSGDCGAHGPIVVPAFPSDARVQELQERLDRIHEAARVDRPDEDKHQLAVRIMKLARPEQAIITMETTEGFKGSD